MPTTASRFRAELAGGTPLVAPLVLNPLMALLAEQAGFRALYLGGGSLGYLLSVTEANLALPEIVHIGVDIRTVCTLPLILDGACGWGDPMHLCRTIGMAEAAGFVAIEIEILPKRAHHHVGLEHIIPTELMVAKVEAAVAARRDADFAIIARTNAARTHNLDEALRRGEALHRAGADLLFVLVHTGEQLRAVAERLPPPLMVMTGAGGPAALPIPPTQLHALGYRLIVDPVTPFLAMHRALRQSYAALATGAADPTIGVEGKQEQEAVHETIGLERLLEIERRTVER